MRIFTIKAGTYILLLLIITFLSGCDKKNDPDLIPSYLYIEKIGLNTTYQQGTSSNRITDAWVYVDETLIGAFELPATVPILTEGRQNITVRPGIKINGISSTRSIYPFFTDLEQSIVLVKDSLVNFTDTVTTYKNNAVFTWTENFDLSGTTIDTTSKSTVAITRVTDPGLIFQYPGEENYNSAYINLPSDTSIFEATTNQSFDLPTNGTAVFLEINYKTNTSVVVGLYYTVSSIRVQRPLLILNKTDVWNKIYVNLTVPLYDTPSASNIQVFLGAQNTEGTGEAKIYLDNLKLIHF